MNVLKILFNPIFLLAAGLHAGLLMIPVAGGSSDELVPAPDPEGESITVTRIPPTETRPSTPVTAAPTRPVGAAVQPRAAAPSQPQVRRRAQNGQSGSSDSATASPNTNPRSQASNNRRRPRRTNRAADELAVLPANDSTPVNPPAPAAPAQSARQTPPDLTALKAGARSQDVSKKLLDFFARLRHSVLKTTDPEVEAAKMTWLATLEEQPNIQISDPQALDKTIEISYPLTIEDNGPRQLSRCLTPKPEKGLVGVVVNEEGELATKPTLLRSSGYGFINDIAMAKIQDDINFPEENIQKIYTVNIEVDYDKNACVDLAKLRG